MKQYSDGKDLHKLLFDGVDKLADNVASTYGPRGRNVIYVGWKTNHHKRWSYCCEICQS